MLARFAAGHPLVYTLFTGVPYAAFAFVLPDPTSYIAMLAWTVYRVYACVAAMRIQRRDAVRKGARYGS